MATNSGDFAETYDPGVEKATSELESAWVDSDDSRAKSGNASSPSTEPNTLEKAGLPSNKTVNGDEQREFIFDPIDDNSHLFMGQKERRRSSAAKTCEGDYLNLATHSTVLKMLAKNGEKKVLFSDFMAKVNRRNKLQKRILLISDRSIYNLDPSTKKTKRRIALGDLGHISLSKLKDNFMVLHVPVDYDYLILSAKKIEIVEVLKEAYQMAAGRDLQIVFENVIEYRVDHGTVREIRCVKIDGGVSSSIFPASKSSSSNAGGAS